MSSYEKYEELLNFDRTGLFVLIFVGLALMPVGILIIRKLLPANDPSESESDRSDERIVRKLLCVVLIVGLTIVSGGSAIGVYKISIDIRDELYISCSGSFTTNRDTMFFTSENGEKIKLALSSVKPPIGSCDHATIVYSKNSEILLDVIID